MEILASLFASPKVVTKLFQSCNVNTSTIVGFTQPMLAKGLIAVRMVDGQVAHSITMLTLEAFRP